MDESFIVNIKGLVANARLEDAIKEVLTIVNANPEYEDLTNSLLMLASRYNRLNREVAMGVIARSEEDVIRNQVNFSFLSLLEEVVERNKSTPNNIIPTDKLSNISEHNIVARKVALRDRTPANGESLVVDVGEKPVPSKSIEELITSQNKIKILFIASNPQDTDHLRLEKEMREIDMELRNARYRDRFTFEKYMDARLDDLLTLLLEDTPHFIHFSGHGSTDGIIFVSPDGENSHTVSGKALGKLFKLFNGVACVFLNSCYSRLQGKEIIKHVPNVIGMKVEVPDDTAIVFAKSFYKSIGAGKEIDFAFEFAKVAIGLYNEEGDNIPEHLQQQLSRNVPVTR